MNTERQTLRLSIENRWTAREMAASFDEINFLYNLRLHLDSIEDTAPYWDEMYDFLPPFRRLTKKQGYKTPFYLFHGPVSYTHLTLPTKRIV